MSSSTIGRLTVYFDDEIKVYRDIVNSYNLNATASLANVPRPLLGWSTSSCMQEHHHIAKVGCIGMGSTYIGSQR